MYRFEAKERIKTNPDLFLKLDNRTVYGNSSNPGYICPICGSGSGNNGTGMTSKDGIHFTCWANNCFDNSDVLDIIGKVHGLTKYNDKLRKACELYGIDYSELQCDPDYKRSTPKQYQQHSTPATTVRRKRDQSERTDYLDFFQRCMNHRYETDYLTKRGISEETQDRFWIGFSFNWRSPTALKRGKHPPSSPRIIIPTSRYSYVARDTRPYATTYTKMKEGQSNIFNLKALTNLTTPVFVTEGEIDALSIEELGYSAIGLGSISNIELLVNHLREHRPEQPLLIALDNDVPGWDATDKLERELKELGIKYYVLINEINGDHKDVNERLIADRDGLREAVEKAVNRYIV